MKTQYRITSKSQLLIFTTTMRDAVIEALKLLNQQGNNLLSANLSLMLIARGRVEFEDVTIVCQITAHT